MLRACRGNWSAGNVPYSTAWALVTVVCLGCAGESAAAAPTVTSHAAANEHWADIAVARSWPLVRESFVSRGHGIHSFFEEVRVAPSNLDAYRQLAQHHVVPVGTVVAAFHRSREIGAPSSIYAMTKRADGDWQFLVAAPDGTLDVNGDLALCARCHAEAPDDHLFGLPATVDATQSP